MPSRAQTNELFRAMVGSPWLVPQESWGLFFQFSLPCSWRWALPVEMGSRQAIPSTLALSSVSVVLCPLPHYLSSRC